MESKTLLSLDLKRSSMLQVVRAKKGDTAAQPDLQASGGVPFLGSHHLQHGRPFQVQT